MAGKETSDVSSLHFELFFVVNETTQALLHHDFACDVLIHSFDWYVGFLWRSICDVYLIVTDDVKL